MIEFLYSFLLFLAGTLLLLGYAVVLYAAVVAVHYIFKHDQDEAIYNDTLTRFYIIFPLKILFFIILSCGLVFLYADSNNPTNDIELGIMRDTCLMILVFGFFFLIGLNVYFIDQEYDYYDFSSYFLDKRFFCALLVITVLLFVFYIDEASRWLRSGNTYRKAKYYIIAGQNLQSCKWLLTTHMHPEIFLVRPITALQRVIFKRAERLIPDDDAEAAAWENRWFHSHYTRKLRVSLGDKSFAPMTEKEHPGSRFLASRWWHCLEEMGSKPLQDERVKKEIYMVDYARLAFVFHYMISSNAGIRRIEEWKHLLDEVDFFQEKFRRQLYPWLVKLMEEWKRTQENRIHMYNYPEEEALGQVVLAEILYDVIHTEIRTAKFQCSNESTWQYLAILRKFHDPENGEKPAYVRVRKKSMAATEEIDAGDVLYQFAVATARGWPGYAIEKYCGESVPGRRALICQAHLARYGYAKSREYLMTEECAEKVRHKNETMQGPEKQILEEVFHGK